MIRVPPMLSPTLGVIAVNCGTKVRGKSELKPVGSPSAKFKIIFTDVSYRRALKLKTILVSDSTAWMVC